MCGHVSVRASMCGQSRAGGRSKGKQGQKKLAGIKKVNNLYTLFGDMGRLFAPLQQQDEERGHTASSVGSKMRREGIQPVLWATRPASALPTDKK